jgi:hypothetical protein
MIRFTQGLVLVALAAVLFFLNWHCWKPGVGGASGGRPPGTQLERFFGWPAIYLAEFWRSDDEALAARILESAPFYYPGEEMTLEYSVWGVGAIAVDVAFALSALAAAFIILESLQAGWSKGHIMLLAGAGLLLLVLLAAGPAPSVSL